MRPDYFVAGFYKCGTTTLYDILKMHKDILVSEEKENDFFMDEKLYKRGIKWYEQKYYDGIVKKEGQIVLEINPHLSGDKDVAKRLRRYYPQGTKILFILRNPVNMFYSHFRFNMQLGEESWKYTWYTVRHGFSKAFDKYLNEKPNAYKMFEYHYSGQIAAYIKYFGVDNVHCVFLEDLREDRKAFFKDIFDFFGVCYDENLDYSVHSNQTETMPANIFKLKLYAYFRRIRKKCPQFIQDSEKLDKVQDYLYKVYDGRCVKKDNQLSMWAKRKLQRDYSAEKRRVEKMTGRKLNRIWW